MAKKKQRPLFSIITVCYNEGKHINNTCKSVSAQNYKDFEWIVIDGKSTDKTLEIIRRYKKYITSLTSEKDSGVYNAMNKGIKKARGEYLLFLNGGDFLKNKNVLKNVADFIEQDKGNKDIYYGDLLYDNGETVSYKNSILNEKFFITKTISHQATFIRKSLFSKYGNYNENYRIVSDYEFWIKTIVKAKVKTKYMPIIISIFNQGGISTNYKLANKQINEKNDVLLKYKLINKIYDKILRIRWFCITMLKRIGFYKYVRKVYRQVIKR